MGNSKKQWTNNQRSPTLDRIAVTIIENMARLLLFTIYPPLGFNIQARPHVIILVIIT